MAAGNAIAPIYDEAEQDDDALYRPIMTPKKDTRSKLIRSKEKFAGLVINACPFNKDDTHLDEQMYCEHMIGTTDQNDPSIFYPIKARMNSKGQPSGFRFTDGSDPQDVRKTDVLVRITNCYRVYRKVKPKDEE